MRIKASDGEHRVNFGLMIALFVLPRLLLACDALLAIIPCDKGRKMRKAADTLHAVLLGIMDFEPQNYVDVNVKSKKEDVLVKISTIGFKGGLENNRVYLWNDNLRLGFAHATLIPFFARLVGCFAALMAANLIFPETAATIMDAAWGSLLLAAFYTALRPLSEALLLLLNLFAFGLATPFMDALYVLWAAAWVKGLSINYWQAVVAALLISIMIMPYAALRRSGIRMIKAGVSL